MENQPTTQNSPLLSQDQFRPGIIKERMLVVTDTIASGDMFYGDGNNNFLRLPAGEAGQVLEFVDGVPAWTTPTTSPTITFDTTNSQALFTTSSGTLVDVTGTDITINPTSTVKVQAIISGSMYNATNTNALSVALYIDGNIIQTVSGQPAGANQFIPFVVSGQATLSAGARVIKLQAKSSGGASGNFDQANTSIIWG